MPRFFIFILISGFLMTASVVFARHGSSFDAPSSHACHDRGGEWVTPQNQASKCVPKDDSSIAPPPAAVTTRAGCEQYDGYRWISGATAGTGVCGETAAHCVDRGMSVLPGASPQSPITCYRGRVYCEGSGGDWRPNPSPTTPGTCESTRASCEHVGKVWTPNATGGGACVLGRDYCERQGGQWIPSSSPTMPGRCAETAASCVGRGQDFAWHTGSQTCAKSRAACEGEGNMYYDDANPATPPVCYDVQGCLRGGGTWNPSTFSCRASSDTQSECEAMNALWNPATRMCARRVETTQQTCEQAAGVWRENVCYQPSPAHCRARGGAFASQPLPGNCIITSSACDAAGGTFNRGTRPGAQSCAFGGGGAPAAGASASGRVSAEQFRQLARTPFAVDLVVPPVLASASFGATARITALERMSGERVTVLAEKSANGICVYLPEGARINAAGIRVSSGAGLLGQILYMFRKTPAMSAVYDARYPNSLCAANPQAGPLRFLFTVRFDSDVISRAAQSYTGAQGATGGAGQTGAQGQTGASSSAVPGGVFGVQNSSPTGPNAVGNAQPSAAPQSPGRCPSNILDIVARLIAQCKGGAICVTNGRAALTSQLAGDARFRACNIAPYFTGASPQHATPASSGAVKL